MSVLVVTGASRGIGASIARLGAKAGYSVAVHYHRSDKAAQEVVRGIRDGGGVAELFRADVGDSAEVARMFSEVDARLGKVDVLVNNAGILGRCRVEDMDEATLVEMYRANVFGVFYCSREAVKRMSTRHGGCGGAIVNVSSVASRLGGLAGGSHYASSKGAIDTFTLALAKEVGTEGIRVNALRPGLIDTEIHQIHGGIDPALVKAVPLGRSGEADEVARVALWLATADASYVHGAILDVSGGR